MEEEPQHLQVVVVGVSCALLVHVLRSMGRLIPFCIQIRIRLLVKAPTLAPRRRPRPDPSSES